ncbi:MAG: DsbA family protein [Pseudomonadales bacterium]|nr:DsbA family protein [Pseudomonadales bacterium]
MHSTPAVNAIMAEQTDWQTLLAQSGETTLDVYIDLKSPHAYLAIRPTLEIARDFNVSINFQPYTLSYTKLGLTRSVGTDMQRRPASAAADRKARMYYATAREYAALQNLPLRSPHRLLDSDLAHRVFLFAKRQNLEIPFAMWVYLQGWGSGWRAFELESPDQLRTACSEVGVDVSAFDTYTQDGGEGSASLQTSMTTAEENGFVGAPHYVFRDPKNDTVVGLFGREHLALIRSKYKAAGFAKHADSKAEFSHAWQPLQG